MDQFTKGNVTPLREAIQKALQGVADEYEIIITTGGLRYSPTECSTKITCVCAKNKEGKILLPYEKDFLEKQKYSVGMKNIGDTFLSKNKTFTICGWKPRNRKYPLLAKDKNNSMYKFPAHYAFSGELNNV